MATINGSTNSNQWSFKLEAYELSYDINSNTSVVRVDVYIGRTSSRSYCGGTFSGSVNVDGQSQGYSGTISYPTYINGGEYLYTGITKDFTVGHNADGSKTVGVSASWNANFNPSSGNASGSLGLTTIPRQANITSAPDFNDEQNPTIWYNNSAGNSVSSLQACISFTGANDDIKYRDINKTGNSYTFNLTEDERNVLRKRATGTELNVVFFVKTVIGSNIYYSTLTKKLTIVNANPSDFDFDYIDMGGNTPNGISTTDLTGDNKAIIKGYSNLQVTVSPLSEPKKQSTISYYQVDDTKVYYDNDSKPSTVSLTINKYTKNNIKTNAVDSRGLATSKTNNVQTFIDYQEMVKSSFSLSRSNNGVGEFVTLDFSGTFWNNSFGQVQNEINCYYKFKRTSDGEYIDGTTTILPNINENNFSFSGLIAGNNEQNGFDVSESYDFIVTVYDKINYITYQGIIGSGTPAIAVYKNHASLGGKYDTSLGGTQVWGDLYVNGVQQYQYPQIGEEIVIGTWITGQPIYRTVMQGTIGSGMQEITHGLDIDHIINHYGVCRVSGQTYESHGNRPFPYFATNDSQKFVMQRYNSKQLFLSSTWDNNFYCIVLEYTKNTD